VKSDDFHSETCYLRYFSDCNDEVTVAGVDFISRRPIYGHYLQGKGCFWHSQQSGVTPNNGVTVSEDAAADVLSSIQMHFGLVPKRYILWLVQCFGVDREIRHMDGTLASVFEKARFVCNIDCIE
jgi:hypothetical protein